MTTESAATPTNDNDMSESDAVKNHMKHMEMERLQGMTFLSPDELTEKMKGMKPLDCINDSNSILENFRKLPSADALNFHLNEVLIKLQNPEEDPNFDKDMNKLLTGCQNLMNNLKKEHAQIVQEGKWPIKKTDNPVEALIEEIIKVLRGPLKPEAVERIGEIKGVMTDIQNGCREIVKEQDAARERAKEDTGPAMQPK
jgi:hypothetical protein